MVERVRARRQELTVSKTIGKRILFFGDGTMLAGMPG